VSGTPVIHRGGSAPKGTAKQQRVRDGRLGGLLVKTMWTLDSLQEAEAGKGYRELDEDERTRECGVHVE